MGLAKIKTQWTVEEYLAAEMTSDLKHEFVSGQIYAIAGASSAHGKLVNAFATELTNFLRDKNCDVYTADMKVAVSPQVYYYPDVLVTCEGIPDNSYISESPGLIIEVLSPSTERTDRYEKKREYQFVAGLREYVIVAQDKIQIEVYRHQNAGEPWQCEIYTEAEQEIFFASVGVKILMAEIYRRINFESSNNE